MFSFVCLITEEQNASQQQPQLDAKTIQNIIQNNQQPVGQPVKPQPQENNSTHQNISQISQQPSKSAQQFNDNVQNAGQKNQNLTKDFKVTPSQTSTPKQNVNPVNNFKSI